jgi:hypothetical protein
MILEKGYYIMEDGTKSTDPQNVEGKKKSGKSDKKKSTGKRGSALDKSMKSEKSGKKKAQGGKGGKTKKSDDDLDINSDEDSEVANSD